ncbi:MAG: peptide-methionine (R)-S-oxide reductase MsrB [Patescibacteria group bacterium]
MLTYNQVLNFSKNGNNVPPRRVEKTDEEWKKVLTKEQFEVTRQKSTELKMSSNLCTLYEAGIYACVCCDTELFDNNTKYDSQSGWPSFTEPIRDNVVSYHEDGSHGMSRVEVVCSVCEAHLGHVFPDGPMPLGLRFCINGVSLKKK